MVDTTDLKSVVRKGVPVRVRPAVLICNQWFTAIIFIESVSLFEGLVAPWCRYSAKHPGSALGSRDASLSRLSWLLIRVLRAVRVRVDHPIRPWQSSVSWVRAL